MIIVTSLREAPLQFAKHGARRAISILSPDTPYPSLPVQDVSEHLRLSFHDIDIATAGLSASTPRDAERLVNFISAWDKQSPMLIHCWAGISRSTAAAFVALCLDQPESDEQELAFELRAASPSATPNRLIITQVDALLGRKGRMEKAIAGIGRGAEAFEGTPFILKTK